MRGRPDLAAVPPPPPSSKARVLVVDDHALIRESLAQLINRQNDLVCCGRAENIHAALEALRAQDPDVALVDLCLGHEDGLELVRRLRTARIRLRILVLSQLDETVYGERAFHAGADGYVMKEQAANAILQAIRKVLAGQAHFHSRFPTPAVAPMLTGSASAPGPRASPLTGRERQVLESLASGLTDAQIAADLGLSVETIETDRAQLQQKLGFASGAELVRYAGRWVRHQLKPHASRAH